MTSPGPTAGERNQTLISPGTKATNTTTTTPAAGAGAAAAGRSGSTTGTTRDKSIFFFSPSTFGLLLAALCSLSSYIPWVIYHSLFIYLLPDYLEPQFSLKGRKGYMAEPRKGFFKKRRRKEMTTTVDTLL